MSAAENALVPVFVPALVVLLRDAERKTGRPLTEDEVLAVRDSGVCIMLPVSDRAAFSAKRGYDDLDPERCWPQWQAVRAELAASGPGAG